MSSENPISTTSPPRPAWRGLRRALARLGVSGRGLVILVPMLWLTLFFLVPLAIVFQISLAEKEFGQPPYSDLISFGTEGTVQLTLHFTNFLFLLSDTLYVDAYLSSLTIAAVSTVFALLIGYPMAYGIARAPGRWQNVLLMLVILPFWTSFLLRVYAWMGFMRTNGVINNLLLSLGIIQEPIVMLQTDFAVYVGIVYTYLPFMILPLYATLVKLDRTLLEASADLGATPWQTFRSVTLPLSMPGVFAGSLLVFVPAIGEYVIPALLGGPGTLMIGRVLFDEFSANRDWPVASAVAVAMLVVIVVPIMLVQHARNAVVEGKR